MCDRRNGCEKPSELKGKPRDCPSEQVARRHGDAQDHPCTSPSECEKPENLRGTPEDCSPEQIRKCHGETEGHPCVTDP